MGFSPSTKHTTTTSIFSNIVDADTGSFVTSLTVSGVSVRGIQYSYLREEQASGVNGGTFTSGAYRTRVLNTKAVDEIGITLSSDQFTLPAGTYNIRARAPAIRCDRNKTKLRNITDSTDEIVGASSFSTTGSASKVDSWVIGQFTITASKAFEIQHRCTTTQATNGFGAATTYGDIEVYAEVLLEKLG